jgi:two-component system, NtrC family, sensor kinase
MYKNNFLSSSHVNVFLVKQIMLVLILEVFFPCCSIGQGNANVSIIDSLKNQLRNMHEDTSRIKLLNDLAENYQNNPNDSVLKYANIALALSDKLLNTDAIKKSVVYTITCKLLKARALENIASTQEKTNTPGALETYQKALDLETETGNKEALAHTYEWMGNMYYYSLGKLDDALKTYQLCLNLRMETGEKAQVAMTYRLIASLYQNSNKFDDALKFLESGLDFSRKAGDKDQMAYTYSNLGEMYYASSNYSDATKYYELSLNMCKETGNKHLMSDCYRWIGDCQRVMGHYGDGIESELNALQISREIKDTGIITLALEETSEIYISVKDYGEALKNCQAELNIFKLRRDSSGIASVYSDIGYIKAEKGEFEDALNYYNAAIPILKTLKDYYNLDQAFLYLSILYNKQGKYPEAIEKGKTQLQYAELYGNKKFIAMAYYNVAEMYMKASDTANALTNYYESFKVSTQFSLHKQGAFACQRIASVALSQGKTTQAIDWLNKATALTPTTEYILLRDNSQKLSEAYEKEHDFKNAFASQVKFKQFSDSVASKEKAEKLTTLTNQLEFENKRALQKASQDKIIALRESEIGRQKLVRNVSLVGLTVFIVFAVIFFIRFREKRKLSIALEQSITDLKSTQKQLVHAEKMASLGELTAGIAHEIQNPLNFVNNFSEVNTELIDELEQEAEKGNIDEVKIIAKDIKENSEKINHHGKRADAIVKGMLQHSRSSTGVKESTNINKLADEYLRLSYHGLRAKDKEFSAEMKTDFDNGIGKINIIPQDIGRVLLNLYNNAFYAVNEKAKQQPGSYEPIVSVTTKKKVHSIELTVKDNGNGVPQKVIDKIFQPFFTTKPTGEGTGLGLSLSYDIIKAHGGEIKVNTREGEFTEFVIQLPITV